MMCNMRVLGEGRAEEGSRPQELCTCRIGWRWWLFLFSVGFDCGCIKWVQRSPILSPGQSKWGERQEVEPVHNFDQSFIASVFQQLYWWGVYNDWEVFFTLPWRAVWRGGEASKSLDKTSAGSCTGGSAEMKRVFQTEFSIKFWRENNMLVFVVGTCGTRSSTKRRRPCNQ